MTARIAVRVQAVILRTLGPLVDGLDEIACGDFPVGKNVGA
jgi:hypothetical protein